MIIERVQKTVLFEEAAKRGITRFELESVPTTYLKMLGTPDMGTQRFGLPTAPLYTAKDGELINVNRLSKFFTGLSRDVTVVEQALDEVGNKIFYLHQEFWAKSQLLKNRSLSLSKAAEAERNKTGSQASWTFSDSFTDTNWIDWSRSGIWVDSSEGIAFLPSSTNESAINVSDITVSQIVYSLGVDNLSSTPDMAIDGLDTTNWRGQFTSTGQVASAVFEFSSPQDISAVQLDPTGFGIYAKLEYDAGSGFQEVTKEVLYRKTTLSAPGSKVSKVRITFSPEGAALPKAAGLRSLRFFKTGTVDSASMYTTTIGVPVTFSEIKIDFAARFPEGADIKAYYSFDNVIWKEAGRGQWVSVRDNESNTIKIRKEDVLYENGLYNISTDNYPISKTSGVMLIGKDQVEVTALRKDYLSTGELPHTPSLEDYSAQDTRKFTTWLDVGTFNERSEYPNHLYLQPEYGVYTSVIRGENTLPYQFQVKGESYMDFAMLLMSGSVGTRIAQPNHTYKVSYQIFIEQDYVIDSCKYFFYQGIRARGAKPFRDVGRSYGAFSVFVNNSLVCSSSKPYTVYSTADSGSFIEGGSGGQGEAGTPFSIALKRGWNSIDVLVHTIDPLTYGEDQNTPSGIYPYLQLSLFPSLFDERLRDEIGITKIVASGERGPVSEFDLLWNVPQDPKFWAWSTSSSSLLFNTWNVQAIDGFLTGSGPNYELDYKGLPDADVSYSEIRARFDFSRSQITKSGPILEDYQISAR